MNNDKLVSLIPGLAPQEASFVLLLVINTVISLAYLIIGMCSKKQANKKVWLNFLIAFFCPGLGLVILAFTYLLFKISRNHEIDLDDISFSQDRVKTLQTPNVNDEINVVPIEEAMAVADKSELRGLVLRVLKNDMEMSLTAITKALSSSDSETSHYSASVLVSALSDFRNSVHNLSDTLRQNPDNTEIGLLLIDSLTGILQQNILGDFEQRSYINTLDWAADVVFENNTGKTLLPHQYKDIASLLISDKEYIKAEKWCSRAMDNWPDEVDTWNINLRLCYSTQNQERFFQLLQELKHSSVVLDQKTLDLVRVFS